MIYSCHPQYVIASWVIILYTIIIPTRFILHLFAVDNLPQTNIYRLSRPAAASGGAHTYCTFDTLMHDRHPHPFAMS